ncbi:MAG: hypothetical protein HN352_08415 [Bacteroidetes bacterium]|nr:hypothetical protein [Bacteroidota bacterium]MBT4400377.1 hypothetical protein [Bacteroidota bacterium]MBT7466584.1 hypothetical protein [Bacteroidota bacterium]
MQVLIPVLGFLPFITFILFKAEPLLSEHNAQGWLYTSFAIGLSRYPVWMILFSYLQMVVISFVLFRTNIKYELLGQRTVLISYLFIIISCIPLVQQFFHPAGLSSLFIFAGLVSLFRLYHNHKGLPDIFNAGVLLGLAILCYPPMILVFVIYVLAIARLKQIRWRDFVVLLLGIMVPVWIVVAILLINKNIEYAWIGFIQWFEIRTTWPPPLSGNSILWLIWFGWILLSLPMLINAGRSRKDVGRRILNVFIQFVWIVPLMILLFERVSLEVWQLVAIPLSLIYSMIIINSRQNRKTSLLFLSFLIFLVVFQIQYFIA